jgi:hypothetical protein
LTCRARLAEKPITAKRRHREEVSPFSANAVNCLPAWEEIWQTFSVLKNILWLKEEEEMPDNNKAEQYFLYDFFKKFFLKFLFWTVPETLM